MYHRRTPSLYKPYPEIAEPERGDRPYSVLDSNGRRLPSNGMTSLERRVLFVPFDAEHHGVALHELGHVRWSPKKLPRFLFDRRFLMAVEDARINLGLQALALRVELGSGELAEVGALARADLVRRDALGFVLRAVAGLGTNAEQVVSGAALDCEDARLYELVLARLERVRRSLLHGRAVRHSEVASFDLVLRLAEELARDLTSLVSELGYASVLPPAPEFDDCGCFASREGLEHAGRRGRPRGFLPDEPHLSPGRLLIVTAPMPHESPRARHGRRKDGRPWNQGDQLRYPHRFAIDQAVFRRRMPGGGGSVLIDTSGSMKLEVAAIDRLLIAALGAACVAIYSGNHDEGELRIIARGDRRADPLSMKPYARGNVVDLPALEWLARQCEPRIWVSDGNTTGIGDIASPEMRQRCEEVVRRGRILRVATLEEAAKLLSRGIPAR